MSLINKMLQDLEARDGEQSTTPNARPHENLRPVSAATEYAVSKSPLRLFAVGGVLVAVLTGIGLYFYNEPAEKSAVATIRPVPPPAQAPIPVAKAPAPVPAPAPVATPVAQQRNEAAAAPAVQTANTLAPASAPEPVSTPTPNVASTVAIPSETPVPSKETVSADVPVEQPLPPVASAAAPEPAVAKAEIAPTPSVSVKPKAKPAARSPKAAVETKSDTVVAAATSTSESETDKGVVEKRARPVLPAEQADAHYHKAVRHLDQGRMEDARGELRDAMLADATHRKARELAAVLAMRNGRLREAQDLLVKGRQLAPDDLGYAHLLARVYVEQSMETQAVQVLESVRAAGTQNADYLSFLAALYQRSNRHSDAVAAYREAVALRATDARAWLGLGISLEATQDKTASQAYERAIKLGSLDTKLTQYAQQRLAGLK